MKIIYWKKIDVWCKYPFQQDIDHRYIEFYSSKKRFEKYKYEFTCDSQIVGYDRVKFVAEQLNMNPKNIKLVKIN